MNRLETIEMIRQLFRAASRFCNRERYLFLAMAVFLVQPIALTAQPQPGFCPPSASDLKEADALDKQSRHELEVARGYDKAAKDIADYIQTSKGKNKNFDDTSFRKDQAERLADRDRLSKEAEADAEKARKLRESKPCRTAAREKSGMMPRVDLHLVYLYARARDEEAQNLNGGEAGLALRLRKHFSMVAELSGAHASTSVSEALGPPINIDLNRYTFSAGPQINTSLEKQWSAFVDAQLGAVHDSNKSSVGTTTASSSATAFTMELGAGTDIRINDRLDFRLIEIGWNPTFFDGVQNNIRIKTGLVIHFGGH